MILLMKLKYFIRVKKQDIDNRNKEISIWKLAYISNKTKKIQFNIYYKFI